ncbi:membrane protein [Photorhabdus luminescens]|nr:membrane protein [Photorhabdus luminescens]
MGNKRKIIHVIAALAIFLLALSTFFLTGENIISLIEMDEKITFSGSVVIIFFSFPLISYATFFIVFVTVTGHYPKHHDNFVKYFCSIAIVAIVLSFPTSLCVHYKLKNDGYLVCPRISWSSPNTYVKDMKLCD